MRRHSGAVVNVLVCEGDSESLSSSISNPDKELGTVCVSVSTSGTHAPKVICNVEHDDNQDGDRDFRCFNVMGVIGVGKTCLSESAKKEGYATFVEQVNGTLLSDYIEDPTGLAFTFQISMMQAACTRTRDACAMVDDPRVRKAGLKGVVVERPAQENVFFAVANHAQKNMTDAQLARYHRYMGDFVTKSNKDFVFPQGRTSTVMPWAPEQMTLKRMIERNRLSEELYKDAYINELFHSYFEGYLEILMINKLIGLYHDNGVGSTDAYDTTKWKTLHVPFIVDWTNFGTWKDVEDQVDNEINFAWQTSRDKVTISCPREESIALVDEQGYPVCMINDNDEKSEKPLFVNLSWYYEHRKSHRTVASKIRDAFFRARIHKREVVFVLKPGDCSIYFGGPKYYK